MESIYPASIGKRFFVFIIDLLLTLFVTALFTRSLILLVYLPKFWAVFLWSTSIFYFLYQSISVVISGTTIGKKLFGLKVVINGEIKKPPVLTEILRESILKAISVIPLGLGFSLAIFDKNQKTWHDKLSTTQVISDKQNSPENAKIPSLISKIILFVFLLSFTILAGWVFPLQAVLVSLPDPIPCHFPDDKLLTESNHFKIYLETGPQSLDPKLYKLMFEQAFDYSFWLISPIVTRTSNSTVCIYQQEKNFSDAYNYHGGTTPAQAFYGPTDQSIHFTKSFLETSIDEQKGTIYHEVNHFILFLYLTQNNYPYLNEVPDWFKEGLASLVEYRYQESSLTINDLKKSVAGNENSWQELSNFSLMEEKSVWSYYDQGLLIMKFLEEKYETDIFPKIIQGAVNSKQPMEKTVENITNEGLPSLESEWKIWLTK